MMSPVHWPCKDPDEVLDYGIDWSRRLGDDTITDSIWQVPDGLVRGEDTKTDKGTVVWLSAGEDHREYKVVNRITTMGGRTMEQSVILRVLST